VNREELTAD